MKEWHLYEVGKLYNENRTFWEPATQYNFRSGTHELLLFMNDLTSNEINAVRHKPVEFALFVNEPVIFMCYNFIPFIPWGDAPFSINMVPEDERTIPEIPQPFLERHIIQITLIESTTGIIKALRAVSLSPEFTAELHMAIRRQAESNYTQEEFDETLARTYATYLDTAQMIPQAVIKCRGGS